MFQSKKVMFDYKILHRCTYPVDSSGTPELEVDCGEPATALATWTYDDGEDAGEMYLCPDHLSFVINKKLLADE